jgi:hypothetical protein
VCLGGNLFSKSTVFTKQRIISIRGKLKQRHCEMRHVGNPSDRQSMLRNEINIYQRLS